jgi:hypothetical protein
MPGRKGFDGPLLHSRNVPHVLALLLSGLRGAGVFAGLDSEKSETRDPPADGEWVFSFWAQQRSTQSALRRLTMSVGQERRQLGVFTASGFLFPIPYCLFPAL